MVTTQQTTKRPQGRARWPEGYVSVHQAAIRADLPEKMLRRWVRQGILPTYRAATDRRAHLVKMEDVERLCEPVPIERVDVCKE